MSYEPKSSLIWKDVVRLQHGRVLATIQRAITETSKHLYSFRLGQESRDPNNKQPYPYLTPFDIEDLHIVIDMVRQWIDKARKEQLIKQDNNKSIQELIDA